MKTILITGAGQDATVAAHRFCGEEEEGCRVIIAHRYSAAPHYLSNLPVHPRLETCTLDITDASGVRALIRSLRPTHIINTAAKSHVHESFKAPQSTFDVNTGGVINFLEAIRHESPETRFLTCSTSEMFGSNLSYDKEEEGEGKGEAFQNEETPFQANSPYAASKIAAHNMVELYRRSYNLHCCSSICFNHSSIYRTPTFVERKISLWLAGDRKEKLKLGNIDAMRDWSHASDMISAMWLMLNADMPRDYVVASGEAHSIRELLAHSFSIYGLNYEDHIEIDPSLFRPCEVPYLRGDPSLIKAELHWEPRYDFRSLIREIVEYDRDHSRR